MSWVKAIAGTTAGVVLGFLIGTAMEADFQEERRIHALKVQQHHYRQLLADTHKLYSHKPQQCLEIIGEVTKNELIKHLTEACNDSPTAP